MISLKAHGILDYVMGVFLVLCPYLFGFADVPAARNTFVVLGYGWIFYSLLTSYTYSLFKLIPLSAHMFLDVFVGLVLMLAPTIFDYRATLTRAQYGFHFVVGVAALTLVTFTRERVILIHSMPETRHRPH